MNGPDARQLDGTACLVCADERASMVSIGRVDGTQVFACGHHPVILARRALADAARAGHRVTSL